MVISDAELEAHRAWVANGRTGPGQLVLLHRDVGAQQLAGHDLRGMQAQHCRFEGAVFGDAQLDDAVFTACDLRGADLSAIGSTAGTSARARFERCDLRGTIWLDRDLTGAVFVDCKLGLSRGRPRDITGIEITRPDLATDDEVHLGRADDVLGARWQVTGPAPGLSIEDKQFLRDSWKRQWARRQRPPEPGASQRCPLCGREVPRVDRYPRYVCRDCLDPVTDDAGRRVAFFNTSLGGGFEGRYVDDEAPYGAHACRVRGVRCRADEARFGGIVYELDGDPRIQVVDADLTTLAVDAVVNATDRALSGGGGLDRAIHRAAGPALRAACDAIGACPVGDAVLTPGFDLPAPWIIHTVGPVWAGGDDGEPALLAGCYRRALELARARALATVACPLIGTGAHRVPMDVAARLAIGAIREALAQPAAPGRVLLCAFGDEAMRAVVRELAR